MLPWWMSGWGLADPDVVVVVLLLLRHRTAVLLDVVPDVGGARG